MKTIRDINIGDNGYIIYNFNNIKVTVSNIVDLSYHGSSYDVFYTKELPGESFNELYTLEESIKIRNESILNKINYLNKDILEIEKQKEHLIKILNNV